MQDMGFSKYDFLYGDEAEQFSFYRLPKTLVNNPDFKDVSIGAKVLYGMLLDRAAMSRKNGWIDNENRVYIYYTVENIMEDLQVSRPTAITMLKELDSKTGIGLISKVRQGMGRPDIIYVRKFIEPQRSTEKPHNIDNFTEVNNFNFKKLNNLTSRSKTSELHEVKNFNPNNTNMNNNNKSDIYPSITGRMDGMDEAFGYINLIKENVDYDRLIHDAPYGDRELYEELFAVISDTLIAKKKYVRIGGANIPYQTVVSRLVKLDSENIDYVLDGIKNTTTNIKDVRSYMLTALYNAPVTMNTYFTTKVNHDMYGAI